MYLLFAGLKYYPRPSSADYRGEFNCISEAKEFFEVNRHIIGDCKNPDIWCDIIHKELMISSSYGRIDETLGDDECRWWSSYESYCNY